MKEFILALDQGTTSSRAIVFDHKVFLLQLHKRNLPSIILNRDGLNMILKKSGRHRQELHLKQLQKQDLKVSILLQLE